MLGDHDASALREPDPLATPSMHARSDVDVLARVLVHRPGSELARITAATADDFLFDAPVAVRTAQRDHDSLAEALAADGAEVLELEAVLRGALASPEVRRRLVQRLCGDPAAAERLLDLGDAQLARTVIAGLTAEELDGHARNRRGRGPGGWVVRPLPNLLFTRDLFAVLAGGVARGAMCREARAGEAAIADCALEALGASTWWMRAEETVEGGDVILPGDGVFVIGIGERTSRAGAERLAKRLLGAGAAREVIGAFVPPGGPFHLDLAISLVDEATLLADRAIVDGVSTVRWRADRPPAGGGDLLGAIAAALGTELTVIPTLPETHGRGWDRGANVVALRPGKVVAYADNRATNRRLERAGVEVLPVPGGALGLGRGGPRCLTAPLVRNA